MLANLVLSVLVLLVGFALKALFLLIGFEMDEGVFNALVLALATYFATLFGFDAGTAGVQKVRSFFAK